MLTLDQIIEDQVEHQNARAQHWVDWAQKEGVQASFVVNSNFQSIDSLILSAIDQHDIDLVIMEAQSGPMSAAILGSYTRNVVRESHCPVYVLTRHFYDKQEDRFMDAPAP
jgi:nucleotide-binding universal stress UspA family protein